MPDARCPGCGTQTEPLQEYCVECGLRLRAPGLVPALSQGWRRRVSWYPGDWIWPSLAALAVAAIAASAAIVWTRDAQSAASETLIGDTSQLPTTVPTVEQLPTAPPAATVPTTTTPTRRRPPSSQRRRLIEWPRGRSGWTLVLASLPSSAKREAAVTKARQALDAGLPQVGVLDSSRYSSLHPGYFVVFSGVYDTLSTAQDAASRAADNGYGNAYARRVTS